MKKTAYIGIFIALYCIPTLVYGADFYFEQLKTLSASGENQIVLKIKTGQERVNGVAGKIEIPEGLEVSKINTGSSAVLLWVDQPQVGETISFSGVTPGGFQGDALLFSFEYTGKGSGAKTLKITDMEAVRDDGLGTTIPVKSIGFTVRSLDSGAVSDMKDTDSPEPFNIVLGKNEDMFEGSFFASFVAQDKKTGIFGYQYAETVFLSPSDSDWKDATSPLPLKNTALIKKISVKAIDGEGNVQISTVSGPYRYTVLWIGIIIVLTLCALFFFARRYFYRSS